VVKFSLLMFCLMFWKPLTVLYTNYGICYSWLIFHQGLPVDSDESDNIKADVASRCAVLPCAVQLFTQAA
jgi:hypothetical protein